MQSSRWKVAVGRRAPAADGTPPLVPRRIAPFE